MSFKLIDEWTNIQEIKSTLKDREGFLITVNDKYFELILNNQVFKSGGTDISTDFELMNSYDGNFNFGSLWFWFPVGAPLDVWQSYKVDFFGVPMEYVTSLKSEIVIANGPGDKTADSSSFALNGHYGLDQNLQTLFHTGYAQYPNDPNRITLIKSISLRLDRFYEWFGGTFNLRKTLFANYPAIVFHSKLVLKVINPMEFI